MKEFFFGSKKCQAKDCKQSHSKHFCKICLNQNSDHLSSNCQQKMNESKKIKKQGCKVLGCKQQHVLHFCKVCWKKDSTHFARNCPFGIVLFHGTTRQAAEIIKNSRFLPSADGCLGAGVYFTSSRIDAEKIAKRWGDQAAVIQCKIDENSEFVEDRMHEEWIGVTEGEFKQYVVRQEYIKRIKIVKIHLV